MKSTSTTITTTFSHSINKPEDGSNYQAIRSQALDGTLHVDTQQHYLQQAIRLLITLIQHALSTTIVNTTLLMQYQTDLIYLLSQFYRGDYAFPPKLRHTALDLSHQISSCLDPHQLQQQYRHFFNNHQQLTASRLATVHTTLGSRLKLDTVAALHSTGHHGAKIEPSTEQASTCNIGVFATESIKQDEIVMYYPGLIVKDERPFLNGRIPLQHQFIDSSYKVTIGDNVQLLSGGIALSYAFCAHLCNDAILNQPTVLTPYLKLTHADTAPQQLNRLAIAFQQEYEKGDRCNKNNAKILRHNGNTVIQATMPIQASSNQPTQITISYGAAYWLDHAVAMWRSSGDFMREKALYDNRIQPVPFHALVRQYQSTPEAKRLPFVETHLESINDIVTQSYGNTIPTHAKQAYYTVKNPRANLVDIIASSTSSPAVRQKVVFFKELIKERQSQHMVSFAEQYLLAFATLHELPYTHHLQRRRFIKRLFNHTSFLLFSHNPSEQEMHRFPPQPCQTTTPYLQSLTHRPNHFKLNTEGTGPIQIRPQVYRLCKLLLQQIGTASTATLLHPKRPLARLYQIAAEFHDIDYFQPCLSVLLFIEHALQFHLAQTEPCPPLQDRLAQTCLKVADSLFYLKQYQKADQHLTLFQHVTANSKDSLRFNTLRYEVTRDNIKQALHSSSSASSL